MGKQSKFVTYEGLPGDFYLTLVGRGAKLLRDKIPIESKLPDSKRD